MQSIKFSYKSNGITFWGIIIVFLTIIVSMELNISINMHLAYFFLILSYFISTFIISKKITKGIKEFYFENDFVKIIFFNSFKDSVNIRLGDIKFTTSENYLKIYKKDSNKLIAVAYKELLLESDQWVILLHELGNND